MKNILAENLLRFGVKNLSTSDVSKLHEVNPVGSTITPQGQAAMDKMIADTQALAKGAVGVTFTDGTSEPMKVGSATVEAVNPENWKLNGAIRLVLNTNFGGIAKSIRIGLLTDESNAVKIVGRSGQLLNLDAIGIKSALENWLGTPYQKMLDRSTAANPSPYKTLLGVLNGIAAKYKSTGLAAPTRESKIQEIAPGGSTVSPEAQAQIDKLVAATSGIITNFISKNKITFQTSGNPMTVTGGTLISSKADDANAKSDLILKLDTTFADKLFFYLTAPEKVGNDLLVGTGGGGRTGEISKQNVYSALIYSTGQVGKQIFDKYLMPNHPTTKALTDSGQPNPLDQIASLLKLISDKWKSGTMATRG